MRRASNRNVMAWTFMGNTRMHQVLREKGNKLSHVGIFTFEVSADGTISETGTAVSTILPYVKKWPHIKWLLTIMNHGSGRHVCKICIEEGKGTDYCCSIH